jgi:multidrug resistance efflux pump
VASGTVETSEYSEETEQEQPSGQRAPMVQRLLDAPNLPAFVQDLITTQATTVVGGKQLRVLAHVRPDTSTPDVREAAVRAFIELVKPCVKEGKDGAIEIGAGDAYQPESQYCLITLLRAEGNAVAVSAVITRCMNQERARQRLTSMQLVAGYFELFQLRHSVDQARLIAHSHQHVLQLASAVATAEGFPSAAMNLCNELANRSGASRVALGWYKGRNIKLKALSHTEEFDKKQDLIVQLQRVMEECADQEEIVNFDPTGKSSENVTREAQALSRSQGGNIVLSIPLRQNSEVQGVITMEFLPSTKLGPQLMHGLSVAVDLLAPQLHDRYQNDRWLITKAGLSVRAQLEHVTGPRYMIAKLIIAISLAVVVFVTFFKPMYHVSAPFVIGAPDKVSVSAPFEAIIQEIGKNQAGDPLRPGDHVEKGQLLAQLDLRELNSRKFSALSQLNVAVAEEAKARGDHKNADAIIANARAKQAQFDIDLYDREINESRIVAPFSGQILKGDLSTHIGQKAQLGEELFDIMQSDKLRLELTVAERDIQDVKKSARGRFATDSLPMDKYPMTVTRIIPVPDVKEGNNAFMVYAEADTSGVAAGQEPLWRPGMAGEARIDVGPRRLAWVWTHRLLDFLRLKLWM